MPNRFLIVALMLALLPIPAAAATDSPDPYQALIGVMDPPERIEQTFAVSQSQMKTALLKDENIAALEKTCAGSTEAMLKGAAGLMREITENDETEFRGKLATLLRAKMSAGQAAEAAAFFSSKAGQKFIGKVVNSATYENSYASAVKDADSKIDRNAFDADHKKIVADTVSRLEPDDKIAAMLIATSEWGQTLARLKPDIDELRFSIANADVPPDQEAKLQAAMREALTAKLKECEAAETSRGG
ncbi:MAG: hypothetical protein J2O44_06375 [Porphyrobacter sp.]|nr:hypothetical protein [Porphyrobacter sp.]